MVNGKNKIPTRRIGSVTGVRRTLAVADKNRKARRKNPSDSLKRSQQAIRTGTAGINKVLDPTRLV